MELEKEIKQKEFFSPHHKMIINILFTNNWLSEKIVDRLKPFDITPAQYNILRILRGQHPEPASLVLIKDRMLDRSSDVSRLVERLRRKGLVQRKICEDNRRAVDIRVTGKGLRLLEKIAKADPHWERPFKTLSNREAEELSRLLDKLRG
jgi:DNA-binding MarR family transcriptional regulator